MADLTDTKVYGNASITRSISNSNYVSGWAGSGWRIDQGIDTVGKSTAEFDNLSIRGTLSVYELLINQIRASNGSIFVSSSGKVSAVSGSGPYTVTTEAEHGFAANDVIKAQKFTGLSVRECKMTVSSITSTTIFVAALVSGSAPQVGDVFVRLGNSSDASRQGVVYMSADDTGAPYIDIISGVTSHATWNTIGVTKARLGNLAGISGADANLGTISGYGLYSENVFLKGTIKATAGYIGDSTNGWQISSGNLVNLGTGKIQTGTTGARVELSSSGIAIYDATTQRASLSNTGAGWFGASDKFSWTSAGVVSMAGWTVDNAKIYNTNVYLSSSGYISMGATPPTTYGNNVGIWIGYSSGAKMSLYADADNYLQWSGTALTVKGTLYATAGTIGNWVVSANDIKSYGMDGSNGGIWLHSEATPANNYIKLVTNSSATNYILMNSAGLKLYNGATQTAQLALDGSGWLGVSTSISWTTAGAVSIAGWSIDSSKIYKTNVFLSSSGYISMGATPPTAYGNNVGAWFGYSSGAKMSLYADANNYLQWDGAKLLVKAANFTLDSSGNIAASGGTIGGWTIGSTAIYKDVTAGSDGAGMATDGTDTTSRFWAGTTYANKDKTPWETNGPSFKVTSGGQLYAKNAYISGHSPTAVGIGYGVTSYGGGDVTIGYQAAGNAISSSTGVDNVAIGSRVLLNKYTGNQNVAIGSFCLSGSTTLDDNTGSMNVAIGYNTMHSNTTGTENVAIGASSLVSNTAGMYNVALGSATLFSNLDGESNIAIGFNALSANTSGDYNIAVGQSALHDNTTSSGNVAVGYEVLYRTIGTNNTAVGKWAVHTNTLGYQNVGIGYKALYNITGNATDSSNNTAIGTEAGAWYNGGSGSLVTAYNSIFVGYFSSAKQNGSVNEIVIGYSTIGLGSNTAILGNTNITKTQLRGAVTVRNDSSAGVRIGAAASSDNTVEGLDTSGNLAGIYINYYSAGNVMLGYGGGNVAVGGSNTPNFKLDVVGDARIRSTNSLRFGGTGAADYAFSMQYNSTEVSLDFIYG